MDNDDTFVGTPSCSEALLILDMISDFEFKDGEKLFPQALEIAPKIADLKRKANAADAAIIYVNDNYGRWNEDFSFVRPPRRTELREGPKNCRGPTTAKGRHVRS